MVQVVSFQCGSWVEFGKWVVHFDFKWVVGSSVIQVMANAGNNYTQNLSLCRRNCSLCKRGNRSIPGLATNSIFFCFLFVKTHWFAWRADQWPLIGETLLSSVPPSISLVSDPWKGFNTKGPRLASCIASGATQKQGHHQVCCARRGGPRIPSEK